MSALSRPGHPFKLDGAEETGQRGYQDSYGNFEAVTGIYGKEQSLCASEQHHKCSTNLPCMGGLQEVLIDMPLRF